VIDAFHLPALAEVPSTVWRYAAGEVELRVPQLTPALLRLQVDALRGHRAALVERPVAEIVRSIGRVAERLLDPSDPLRRTAEKALPEVTGYSPAMIRHGLERMAADWRAVPLHRLLAAELGDPAALDGFRPRAGGGRTHAVGPALSFHVFSGNVPGVAVTSLIRTLLLKSPSLGKAASGEPVLAALFGRGLQEEDPDLGACVAVAYWAGGDPQLEAAALERAEAVVAYGGDAAVESLRERTPPRARFLGYGHRLSLALVAREATGGAAGERAAAEAAAAVATFDQQGCVSPHVIYVEDGGERTSAEWARCLARALEEVSRRLPRGALSPGESSAIRQLRAEAEFAQIAGRGTEIHASAPGTDWTVVHDPDPAFRASCLNRVVRVCPVEDLAVLPDLLAPVAHHLQSVGYAAPGDRIRAVGRVLADLGASRIVPIERMPWPAPEWHHDGRAPLRELVRWCDLEPEEA
jgi:hypothetical protein